MITKINEFRKKTSKQKINELNENTKQDDLNIFFNLKKITFNEFISWFYTDDITADSSLYLQEFSDIITPQLVEQDYDWGDGVEYANRTKNTKMIILEEKINESSYIIKLILPNYSFEIQSEKSYKEYLKNHILNSLNVIFD